MTSSASLEIERKFKVLVRPEAFLERWRPTAAWEIWQGYLTPPHAPNEVRVRRIQQVAIDDYQELRPRSELDDLGRDIVRFTMAVKHEPLHREPVGRDGGLVRGEIETVTDEAFFSGAWDACQRLRLHKVRLEGFLDFGQEPRVGVLDVFRDRLHGLTLLEIEFASWAESQEFGPPDIFGVEVTHDPRYRNIALAAADGVPD